MPLFRRSTFLHPGRAAAMLAALVLTGGSAADTEAPAPKVPMTTVNIVQRYPHDTNAFTEGLLIDHGKLYESTGYEGRSYIKRIDLESGKVEQSVQLPAGVFGEGIVVWGNEILNVIWHGGQGQRRTVKDFKLSGKFSYTGEGWGMTRDAHNIILSDGTPVLRFMDPRTMKVARQLPVTIGGVPLPRINELEYVKGSILANVWLTGAIVRIDPATGRVTQIIDLTPVVQDANARNPEAVPNGIAYDEAHDRLFVTGKYWPHVYEVTLAPAQAPGNSKAGS